ncbi:MAG: nuclear transport factor 2 family protein [Cyclobacteriaceae bacterium]|nr:nuclear transport factor 2 family protein [Cyclobacteriaceae bacterium]
MNDKIIKEKILELEQEALEQWSEGNVRGYLLHAADDITYMDDIGAQNRIEGIKPLQDYALKLEGQIPKHNYEVVNPKVQVYGESAILSMKYHPFSPEGNSLTQWKATTVYRLSGGKWKMVHAHWSMNKEA